MWYSDRGLTDNEDRLKALGGVANELARFWGDKYMFGIWKSCVIEQLLWMPWSDSLGREKRRSTRAPTWSWASLNRGVRFKPLSGTIATADELPTGTTTPTEVRLTCKVVTWYELPPGCLCPWANETDVVEDDCLNANPLYLLLGKARRKGGDSFEALKVVQIEGSEKFRRIGHAELRPFEVLIDREPRSVCLV